MRLAALACALIAVLGTAKPCNGLAHPRQQQYVLADETNTIKVGDERELRAALNNPALGWRDQRVVQLTADLLVAATLTISSPVRIEGNCASGPGGRCTLRAALPQPLLHITGPTALVQLGNLQLSGGRGGRGMGGALTVSNHSQVDLLSCVLSDNSAPAGGALVVAATAHVNLVGSEVRGNAARGCGGGAMVLGATLHLDASTVEGNAAAAGGGVCADPGSVVTAIGSRVAGNRLRREGEAIRAVELQEEEEEGGGGEDAAAAAAAAAADKGDDEAPAAERGADILLRAARPDAAEPPAEAFFDPMPAEDATLVSGGRLQAVSQLPSSLPGRDAPDAAPRPRSDGAAAATAVAAAAEAAATRRAADRVKAAGARKRAAGWGLPRRALRAKVPAGAAVVSVNSEEELATAFRNKDRFLTLDSHVILTGQVSGPKSLLPSIKSSVTITGTCATPYAGKCLLNGQALGALLFADNSGFLPGMEVIFENIIFLNGQASAGQGGALSNTGALSVTFTNCDFVNNAAGTGGAVALVEGAFSIFTDCAFKGNAAATDGSGTGTGGAVLLTGSAGFTRCSFTDNVGQNGGAVGVGGSSQGMFFSACTFKDNSAEIFGNDIYMESWVATSAYFDPFPTSADIYCNPVNVKSMANMPPMYYPAAVTSPPPNPPAPPSPPPPAPPAPSNPKQWIYTEEQLWDALNNGNQTIILAAHIQFSQQGKWATTPPPTVISEVNVLSKCKGYGSKCIIDMGGSRFPLFDVQSGAALRVKNVRIMNAASTSDGGAVKLAAPRQALFDSCDFIGNYAANGGAVGIKGSQNVLFSNCNFGLNWADAAGGAVYSVGSTVFFKGSAFYLNHAVSGGALALGPASTAFVLDANFTRNVGTQWGADIFLATPVGSVLFLNKWPPESAAKIFPAQAQVKWYFAPPPGFPAPPSPPPAFKRAPYPPPGPLPPSRAKNPPPSPPSPPPNPPPRPPSPPMGHLVTSTPVMWGPLYVGVALVLSISFIVWAAVHHRRVFPRIENPEELRLRLAGEFEASSDEDYSLADFSSVSADSEGGVEVASGVVMPGALHRRRAAEAAAAEARAAHEAAAAGGDPGAGPSEPHAKRR